MRARPWRVRGAAALLAVFAAAAQLPIFDRNFVPMDEGHLALAASRLLDGDVLYRDVHTGIFPGIYALTAGLFAVFGEELLVTRVAQVAVNAATVALLFLVGLRVAPPRWAVLPPLLFVALVWIGFPVLTMFNYSALAGALALASLLAALRYLERGRTADALAVGTLVGACVFTKQNFGGLAALAIAAGIVLGRSRSALSGRGLVSAFAPIAASGAAFLAIGVAWLALAGALGAWLDSTLLSLVGSQLRDFDNPIPPILGAHPQGDPRFVYLYIPPALFDYLLRGDAFLGMPVDAGFVSIAIRLSYGLPLALLVAAPAWLAWSAAGDRAAPTLVVAFAVAFFFGIFPSAVFSHLVYVLAPVLLLFAWLGHALEERLGRAVFAGGAGFVALVLAACATIPGHVRQSYDTPSGLPHVAIAVSPDQAEIHAGALRFIADCARPGEPIFALPILPVLYLASGHPNPVKWDLLIPGAIDERAIIEALEREQVRCVVKQRDMNPEFPPLRDLYPALDAYVERSYRKRRPIAGGAQLWFGLARTAPFEAAP